MSTKYHIGAGGTENNAKLWWRFVCDENNKIVAQARGTTEEEAYFEASFICKACNSHASLAELVRQSLDRFTDNDMQPPNHALEVWVANAITTLDFDKDTKADKLNKLSLSQQMRKDGWGLQRKHNKPSQPRPAPEQVSLQQPADQRANGKQQRDKRRMEP